MHFCHTCSSALIFKIIENAGYYICPKNHMKIPYDSTKPFKMLFQNHELDTRFQKQYDKRMVMYSANLQNSSLLSCNICSKKLTAISIEENRYLCKNCIHQLSPTTRKFNTIFFKKF